MNKKAEMGQVLTTIPVLILVLVVMVLFIILSSIVGNVSGFSGDGRGSVLGSGFGDEEFLFRDIEINSEKIWVISMILRWENLEFSGEEVGNALGMLIDPFASDGDSVSVDNFNLVNDCIGVSYGSSADNLWTHVGGSASFVLVERKQGEKPLVVTGDVQPRFLVDEGLRVEDFSYVLGGERVYVQYYYGRCFGGVAG